MHKKSIYITCLALFICLSSATFAQKEPISTAKEVIQDNNFCENLPINNLEPKSYVQNGYEDVQKVFDILIIDYTRKDPESIMNLIADNAHIVFFGSGARSFLTNKDKIKEAYEIDFKTINNINIDVPWLSISGKGDIAWLSAIESISFTLHEHKNFINARHTIVFEKINNSWKVVNSHFSFPTIRKFKNGDQ